MLAPMKFPTYQGFLDRWVEFYYDGEYMKQGGIKNIERFKEYVKDIAIRREVKDVEIQMPDVNRTLHFAELDDVEQKTYDHEESEFVKWFNDKIIGGEEDNVSDMNILAEMSRMRHITGLAKIPATEAYVEGFHESTDRKLVIFVHHIDVGDILFQNLQEKYTPLGIDVYQLTGAQSPMERFQIAEKFQSSKRAFCVASTQAAGEGINLQTCGDAILHERQWNPQNEDQAAPGRFRRIGSSHSVVNVTFMTAAGTIDEILAGIVERKRAYFHNAMNSGELVESSGKSLAMELAEALVKNQKEKSRIARMASPQKRK
jgi:SNF2 family DNA or RNA helicase